MTNSSRIDILGSDYVIQGRAEHGYMAEIGRLVDSRMRDIIKKTPTLNFSKVAVLAAINLADELLQERLLREESPLKREQEIGRRTVELISLLDEGMAGDSPLN